MPGELSVPHIFVWGSRWDETRQAGRRGFGFKQADYKVRVYIMYIVPADDPDRDYTFPLLIDVVLAKLRGTQLAINITDPITGLKSQLLSIGERMSIEYSTPRATEDQRLLLYAALVETYLKEVYVG